MRLIDDKIMRSESVPSSIITLADTSVNFTAVRITGMTKGRLMTVIIVFFMPVCTAIAEVKLNMIENAREDNDNTNINKPRSSMGFSRRTVIDRMSNTAVPIKNRKLNSRRVMNNSIGWRIL